jgi:hypothetical protein
MPDYVPRLQGINGPGIDDHALSKESHSLIHEQSEHYSRVLKDPNLHNQGLAG